MSANEGVGTARRRWWRPAVVALVAVALVAVGLVLVLRGDEPSGTITAVTSTTVRTDEELVVPVGPDGGRFIGPGGVVIEVPEGAVDDEVELSVAVIEAPAGLGEALEAVGTVVDVDLGGVRPDRAIRLGFPVGPTRTRAELPDGREVTLPTVAAVGHRGDDGWQLLESSTPDRDGLVWASSEDLSPFGLFRFATDLVVELASSLLEALTGGLFVDVPEPSCPAGTDDAASWVVTPADAPVSWCATRTDDGAVSLQLANRRRYAVLVSAAGADLDASTGDLAAMLSELASLDGPQVLAPGEVVDVAFPATVATPRVEAEYDGLAQSLTALLVAADILAALAAKVPFSKQRSGQQFLRMLDVADCLGALSGEADLSVKKVASFVSDLVTECFDDVLEANLGVLGSLLGGVLGLVGGTVAFFVSSGSALFDLIIGGAEATMVRRPGESTTSTSTPTSAPGDAGGGSSAWPVDDEEGPPALYALFGAELIGFPDWVSCIPTWCIAGIDDTIRAYKLQGVEYRGSIPDTATDRASAVRLLVEQGFSQADAEGLVAPGER